MHPDVGWTGSLVERIYRTTGAKRVLGALGSGRAAWELQRGHPSAAVRTLLGTWRLVGSEALPARSLRRLRALIREGCFEGDAPAPLVRNRFLAEFLSSSEAWSLRQRFGQYPVEERVRLRKPRPGGDPRRQGNLMVVKRFDRATGEKGVLFVMYTETLAALPAVFDLPRLASDYMLVLEPSWWGYQDPRFLFYVGREVDAVVLAQSRPDYEFIRWLDANLVPSRIGAGDWADPAAFRPKAREERAYDVVMVSAWDPFKRHEVLLRAMRALQRRGRRLRAALVGYPLRWDVERIRRLVRRYGLEADCDLFDSLPHEEVARVVADAKVMVLLSRREGANRALYEGLFSDTPVIVYRDHRGVNLDHVGGEAGRLAEDAELPQVLLEVLDHPEAFSPRRWALAHTGWKVATREVNALLRRRAETTGRPWTRDIAPRKNAPNLQYADPDDEAALRDEYRRLEAYLRPELQP